ncbi:hypothetical protein HDU76_006857 [Blyttiomyces sp. JEL0837]|nr:hypothetical protein HDU76_006857 [Blyttiomyces sp. JEL0837]
MSVYLIIKHCQNYFKPSHQRWITRIIIMVPIYSLCQAFLVNSKILILQYVVVRPTMTVLAFIMASLHVLCPQTMSPKYGEFWVVSINLVSVTIAMYALIMFYIVVHHEIEEHKPFWKFVAVKFVVFFSFWQSIVIGILDSAGAIKGTADWNADNTAALIQSFLICFEMVIATFIHMKAFSHKDYRLEKTISEDGESTAPKTRVMPALMDALSPMDIMKDITSAPKEIRAQAKRRKEKKNRRKLEEFGDAFAEKDKESELGTNSVFSIDEGGGDSRLQSNAPSGANSLRQSRDFHP